jgi:LysM domain-containing protein
MSAMPAEAEPRSASVAPGPATVRPRQAGPQVVRAIEQQARPVERQACPVERQARPVERQARPVGRRPRTGGARVHPVGVRACSGVLSTPPPGPAPVVPQARRSPLRDDSPALRLTRRGRVVLAVCSAAAASLFGLAVASSAQAAGRDVPPGPPGRSMTRIVVQPGQTLWSIALQADPRADPRLVVRQIMTTNALPSASLTAGQRLLVPRP